MNTTPKAVFIKSAAKFEDCIVSEMPQIAVVGKSNVGKSSFINLIVNNAKLARTSKDPGRTRLINYFEINDKYLLADLPGYGFAKVSYEEKQKWGALIETYLEKEPMLAHVFFLVDIRHDPTADDLIMYTYLFKRSLPFTIIATKADKIAKSKIINEKRRLAAALKVGADNIIATSADTKYGRDELLAKIDHIIENVQITELNENIADQDEQ